MKVLIAIVFAIGSVSALGSGPYLPSGWRPQGPSFYLPSEISKPSAGPQKENLFQETEASGSDSLREYGPPKLEEVVQVVSGQGLPDVATEQTFFIDVRGNKDEVAAVQEAVAVEATTEQIAVFVEEVSSTEAELAGIVEQTTAAILSEPQPNFEVVAEIVEQTSEGVQATEGVSEEIATPTAAAIQEEVATPAAEEIVVPTAIVQEVEVPTAVVQEVEVPTAVVPEQIVVSTAGEQVVVDNVAEGVNNIAEALVNLEKEVKAAKALEAAVEIKQEISGSLEQAPEGFLEYGPPGFREYGPPKQEELAKSPLVEVPATSAFENNEVRRRRFSPKFKSNKKH